MVSHDSPAWAPSSTIFSYHRWSSCTGTPHSSSWYARSRASPSAQKQRRARRSSSLVMVGSSTCEQVDEALDPYQIHTVAGLERRLGRGLQGGGQRHSPAVK